MVNQLEYLLRHLSRKTKFASFLHKKRKKKFGKNSQIEGIINANENVLLIEDLMTDGGSKIKFLESILKSKAKISMIFVVLIMV